MAEREKQPDTPETELEDLTPDGESADEVKGGVRKAGKGPLEY